MKLSCLVDLIESPLVVGEVFYTAAAQFAIATGALGSLLFWRQRTNVLVCCLEHLEGASLGKCVAVFLGLMSWFTTPVTVNTFTPTTSRPYSGTLDSRLTKVTAHSLFVIQHLLEKLEDIIEVVNDVLSKECPCIWIILHHELSDRAANCLSLVLVFLELLLNLINTHIVENGLTRCILYDLEVIVKCQEQTSKSLGPDGAKALCALSP